MRRIEIDFLKLLLAVIVAVSHAKFLADYSDILGWMFLNGIGRITVPIFLVINGFYFWDACHEKRHFFKWLSRVSTLYIFWMIAFAPVWGPGVDGFAKIVQLFAFGWFHLWYIAGLILAGITLYILRGLRHQTLFGLAFLCFVSGVAIQYLATFEVFGGLLGAVFDWNGSHRNFLLFSFPFMVIGYLLRSREERGVQKTGKPVKILCAVSCIGLLAEAMLIYVLAGRPETIATPTVGIDNYFSQFFAAPLVFVTIKQLAISAGKWNAKWVSQLSSGIYFTHPVFLVWFGFADIFTASVAAVLTLLCSAALTVVLIKVPVLSRRIL